MLGSSQESGLNEDDNSISNQQSNAHNSNNNNQQSNSVSFQQSQTFANQQQHIQSDIHTKSTATLIEHFKTDLATLKNKHYLISFKKHSLKLSSEISTTNAEAHHSCSFSKNENKILRVLWKQPDLLFLPAVKSRSLVESYARWVALTSTNNADADKCRKPSDLIKLIANPFKNDDPDDLCQSNWITFKTEKLYKDTTALKANQDWNATVERINSILQTGDIKIIDALANFKLQKVSKVYSNESGFEVVEQNLDPSKVVFHPIQSLSDDEDEEQYSEVVIPSNFDLEGATKELDFSKPLNEQNAQIPLLKPVQNGFNLLDSSDDDDDDSQKTTIAHLQLLNTSCTKLYSVPLELESCFQSSRSLSLSKLAKFPRDKTSRDFKAAFIVQWLTQWDKFRHSKFGKYVKASADGSFEVVEKRMEMTLSQLLQDLVLFATAFDWLKYLIKPKYVLCPIIKFHLLHLGLVSHEVQFDKLQQMVSLTEDLLINSKAFQLLPAINESKHALCDVSKIQFIFKYEIPQDLATYFSLEEVKKRAAGNSSMIIEPLTKRQRMTIISTPSAITTNQSPHIQSSPSSSQIEMLTAQCDSLASSIQQLQKTNAQAAAKYAKQTTTSIHQLQPENFNLANFPYVDKEKKMEATFLMFQSTQDKNSYMCQNKMRELLAPSPSKPPPSSKELAKQLKGLFIFFFLLLYPLPL